MNKGDALYLILDYTIDGALLKEDDFDEIELCITDRSANHEVRFTLSDGQITWDSEKSRYVAFITQKDTFKFLPDSNSYLEYQIRLKQGEVVISSPITKLKIGGAISKEVL